MKKYKYSLIIEPMFSLKKRLKIVHESNIDLFDKNNLKLSKNKLSSLKDKFDNEVKSTFEDPFFKVVSYSYSDGTRNGL
jgi:hypothetical protein